MRSTNLQLVFFLAALHASFVSAQNDSPQPTLPTALLSSLASATDTSIKDIPSIIASGTESVSEIGSALSTASGSAPLETGDVTATDSAAESASTSQAAAAKVGAMKEDTMIIGVGSLFVAVVVGALGL